MRKGIIEIVFALLALLGSFGLAGQEMMKRVQQLPQTTAYDVLSEDSTVVFESEQLFSAIVIKSETPNSFSLELDGAMILIPLDEDADDPTYFFSLPEERTSLTLRVLADTPFKLFVIQSGNAPSIANQKSRAVETVDCQDPLEFIPQSTWRSGLASPNYSRSFHDVSHNVVHHSAGSNSSTNYTQVVRDIYIYHTQVNGWSDIGYNYLISQDGTIYAGRDPADGSQDDVRGAHFCGRNSGTLGVCLLGNYETANPTSPIWSALEKLLTFQLLHQELDPFETTPHSLGQLAGVVGHRDGCATLCPGENVYEQLEELRFTLQDMIIDCSTPKSLSFEVASNFLVAGKSVTFTNTSTNYDSYRWLLDGAFPSQVAERDATVQYSVPGFYDIILIGTAGAEEDTLLLKSFLQVSLLKPDPVIFPNPTSSNAPVHVDFEKEIQMVRLFEASGRLIGDWELSSEFTLPQIKSGIYLLKIESDGKSYEKKLVVD